VKSAIFSSLGERVVGARVLDLFAGTGSLGIEALSRGAASAVFVEKEGRSVETIRRNLEKTRLTGEVHEMDIFAYLDRVAKAGEFDLILADPPYAKKAGERDFTPELLSSEGLIRALGEGGLFILEHLPGAVLPAGKTLSLQRDKRYGATAVAILGRLTSKLAGSSTEV
jgi:16S rRNA (guanine966-N2)-methyltransferase